jgi:hypothetical protein
VTKKAANPLNGRHLALVGEAYMIQADAGWTNAPMESFRYLALNRLCVLYPTLCTGKQRLATAPYKFSNVYFYVLCDATT